jgi:hypothetical protein
VCAPIAKEKIADDFAFSEITNVPSKERSMIGIELFRGTTTQAAQKR